MNRSRIWGVFMMWGGREGETGEGVMFVPCTRSPHNRRRFVQRVNPTLSENKKQNGTRPCACTTPVACNRAEQTHATQSNRVDEGAGACRSSPGHGPRAKHEVFDQ
jgi:hypothetical protein